MELDKNHLKEMQQVREDSHQAFAVNFCEHLQLGHFEP